MPENSSSGKKVVIIGGGPAGLTAAYELCKEGVPSIVLEKDDVVGGISRTVHHKGYHFDIGGHRFFTKVKAVDRFWHEVLDQGEFLTRSRMSRIYYNKKFFHYPLRAANALFGLGIFNSFLVLLSYLKAKMTPVRDERTFEDWVSNRFGRRLFNIFFKTYTEKVWGIPTSELSAEWASQRIKGLSLLTAVKNALLPQKPVAKQDVIKTLIDSFEYPKRGPGQMWETVAEKIQQNGSELRMNSDVVKVYWENGKMAAVDVVCNGTTERIEGSHFVSTMPVRELIAKSEPQPPAEIVEAAKKLSYRDFLTVALVVNQKDLFPDNWIYIHDPDVQVGRVQNFKNWSPFMVPDENKSCIGLEYFCFEGDGLWTKPDAELVEQAKHEMDLLGLVPASAVEEGAVVRMPKAYPVYDGAYAEALETVRNFVDGLGNLYLVGRNGMHKYNNQDHSMLTAMMAVENIQGANHDIWSVNDEQEYHEEVTRDEDERKAEIGELAATQPHVPMPLPAADPALVILRSAFARVHRTAMGTAMGAVAGGYLMLATLWLVIQGGPNPGATLELLGQYFIGFTVTVPGAFVGLLYGFLWGFILGWLIGYARNVSIGFYVHMIQRRAEADALRNFLNYI